MQILGRFDELPKQKWHIIKRRGGTCQTLQQPGGTRYDDEELFDKLRDKGEF